MLYRDTFRKCLEAYYFNYKLIKYFDMHSY